MVYTGTNFFTAGYTAGSSLDGIEASTVVVDSATQVTATWTNGVPVLSAATKPVLSFKTSDVSQGSLTHFAIVSETVTNELTITSNSDSLQCSFAGGCLFKI